MHGKERTREYRIWQNMKSRCNNPRVPAYKDYGGRGIKVTDKWNDFNAFLADMGPCPPGYTLERLNNDKGYGPVNCAWRSYHDQARNKRCNIRIVWMHQELILKDWAEVLSLPYNTLYMRVTSLGWTLEKAFTTPVQKHVRSKRSV